MLMARGELSFHIPPVSESCAESKTIRQRIGRRIDMKKACCFCYKGTAFSMIQVINLDKIRDLLFVNRGIFVIPEEDVCSNYHIKREERVFAMIDSNIIVLLYRFNTASHLPSTHAQIRDIQSIG